jgi:hypothetical protein
VCVCVCVCGSVERLTHPSCFLRRGVMASLFPGGTFFMGDCMSPLIVPRGKRGICRRRRLRNRAKAEQSKQGTRN